MRRPRKVLICALLALLTPVLLVACGDDDDDGAGADEQADGGDARAGAPAGERVESEFCQKLLAVEAVDSMEDDDPAAVAAGAAQARTLLGEAAAATPEGAPDDLVGFFADTAAVLDAIVAAGGATMAAYQGLSTTDPDLLTRLSEDDAYQETVDYVYRSCGIDIGGADTSSASAG